MHYIRSHSRPTSQSAAAARCSIFGLFGYGRTGGRHAMSPDCMAEVAKKLAQSDIAAISQWLGAQAVPAGAKPATALPAPLPLPCGGVPGSPK